MAIRHMSARTACRGGRPAHTEHINSHHMKRRFFCLFASCNKSYESPTGARKHLKIDDHNIDNN